VAVVGLAAVLATSFEKRKRLHALTMFLNIYLNIKQV